MQKTLVVLVYTRTGWDIKNVTALLPLSVLYLARPLSRAGFQPVIIDQRIQPDWAARLAELAPQALLVGISAMTGTQIAWGLKAAAVARQAAPATRIVWGGIHPSLLPEQTARHPLVDFVVRGEGEITLPELAAALAANEAPRHVAGLTWFDGETLVQTPDRPRLADLSEALIPDYGALRVEDYLTTQTLGLRDLAITTSRGCPNGCRYCYNLPYNGRRWRAQPAEQVVEHIAQIVRRFGVQGILIKDDNFYADRRRVEAIAAGLKSRNLAVTIRGECRADYIARHWDEPFLDYLRNNGFREMTVGAESGDDKTLARLGKDITVADIREANRRLGRAGIPTKFTFMTGFPEESEAARRRTIDLMLELTDANPTARLTPLHLYTPYPGTPLFAEAVAAGYRPPADLAEWAAVSFHNLDLPWIDRRLSRKLEKLSVATYFLDRQTVAEYFTGRPLIQWAARLYSRIIRWRARRMFLSCMPETALINFYRQRH
ncbi:MAG: radical SAM protein [Myxococcales bacterium]|nr:radical SAM protein [Myxococcales bacterium]